MQIETRAESNPVALETTLLVHGVPRDSSEALAAELCKIVRDNGASPAIIGILHGRPIIGLTPAQLRQLLDASDTPKANTANLGALLFRSQSAATTVSTTLEIAAAATPPIRIFATGGLGGVHRGYGQHLDISADLAALSRFPIAVVASGVKTILDVAATREALETLGIPVVGYRTDTFPAFYLRQTSPAHPVDARFDDAGELAAFAAAELDRTRRAVLVVNPIPEGEAIDPAQLDEWIGQAEQQTAAVRGRAITPALLAKLHEISQGATLRANIALVKNNAALAAQICRTMPPSTRAT